jgi:hypothetical protein
MADFLAMRGVQGTSRCPTRRFDVLLEDSEKEGSKILDRVEPVITKAMNKMTMSTFRF